MQGTGELEDRVRQRSEATNLELVPSESEATRERQCVVITAVARAQSQHLAVCGENKTLVPLVYCSLKLIFLT